MTFFYIVSFSAILSSAAAIYLALTRSESYKKVVDHYITEIEDLEEKTTEAINRFAERSEEIALDSIRKIDNDNQVQEISEQLQKIIDQQISLNKYMHELRSENERLQKIISEKDKIIREREAILHRKQNQIDRLKKGKS